MTHPTNTADELIEDLLTSSDPPTEAVLEDAVRRLATSAPLFDPTSAVAAMVALGDAARPHLEAALAELPKGATLVGRKAMMTALADVAAPSSAPVFLAGLSEFNATLREAAQRGMVSLGPDCGLPYLQEALDHRSARIRKSAAQILVQWAPYPAVRDTAKARLDDESRNGIRVLLATVVSAQSEEMPPHEAFEALLDIVLMTHTEVGSSMGIPNWHSRLDEGMPFLAYIFQWVATSGAWYFDPKERMWFGALEHNKSDPLAPWAAIRGLALDLGMSPEEYLGRINSIFGGKLRKPAKHAIRTHHPARLAIYAHLLETNNIKLTDAVHVELMQDTSKRMRALAVGAMAKRGEPAVPEVMPLLAARKAAVRTAAARCLEIIGHESARGGLKAALEKERAAGAKTALKAALSACDPLVHGLSAGQGEASERYAFAEALEANEGLELLRVLVYEDPSVSVWVRICNVLERLRGTSTEALALAYLMDHGVPDWPEAHKPWPDHWLRDDPRRRLGGTVPHRRWLPIHALVGKGAKARLKATLKPVEKGARAKRFAMRVLPTYLSAVEAVWAWCRDNALPVGSAEVRADGGCGYSDQVVTTTLSLWQGVGVIVERRGSGDKYQPPGIRYRRAKVPTDHLLGLKYVLDNQRRLDLAPLLANTSQKKDAAPTR